MAAPKRSYFLPVAVTLAVAIAMGTIVFLNRTSLSSWRLDDHQAHLWEIVLKSVAGYLAITGASVTAMKYLDERVERSETAKRESQKDFNGKRQEVYFQLVESLAEIINHDPPDEEWGYLKLAFFKIYWGNLSLVSDKKVAEAVEEFSDLLHSYEKSPDKKRLVNLARAVVLACRASLGETWDLEAGESPEGHPSSLAGIFEKPEK